MFIGKQEKVEPEIEGLSISNSFVGLLLKNEKQRKVAGVALTLKRWKRNQITKNKYKQGEVAGVAQILNASSTDGFNQEDLEVDLIS